MVTAGRQSIGVKALAQDIGIELSGPPVINSDASVAIGIGNHIGSDKVRHIEVTQLWLQDKVSREVFVLGNIKTYKNLADALTKGVAATAIQRHLDGVRVELRNDMHQIAPELEEEG